MSISLKTIRQDRLGISSGGGTSTIETITQSSHGFSVGNILKYNGTSYALAQANNGSNAEVIGIVSTVADSNNFTITYNGKVSGLSGLTSGATYFLSDSSAGAYTTTEPSTSGYVSRPIFVATSTTSCIFIQMRGLAIPSPDSNPYLKFTYTGPASGGGDTASGTLNVYPINTLNNDSHGIGSLNSNIMTLPIGTYHVNAFASFYATATSIIMLHDVTSGSTEILRGTPMWCNLNNSMACPHLIGRIVLSATTQLQIKFKVQSVADHGQALGVGTGDGIDEIYGQIEFEKIL